MRDSDGNFGQNVEVNVKEGITLRFHQVWVGEKPVYSDEMIAESQSGKKFQVFLFASASEAAQLKGLPREKRKEYAAL